MPPPDLLVCEEAAPGQLLARPRNLLHGDPIGQEIEGLQEALPLLGGNQDARRASLARDLEGLAQPLGFSQEFQKIVLSLRRSDGGHNGHYNGYRRRSSISRLSTGR